MGNTLMRRWSASAVAGRRSHLRCGCDALLAAPLDFVHGLQRDVWMERHALVLQRTPAHVALFDFGDHSNVRKVLSIPEVGHCISIGSWTASGSAPEAAFGLGLCFRPT